MGTGTIIMIVMIVGLFFLMFRSNKKQERETAEMRNNLEVGDEITTIGGIIGEIVKIKEETVTIETGKDRTKIRILRSAVRVVDVHAYEKRGDGKKPEAPVEAPANANKLKVKDSVASPEVVENVNESNTKKKKAKKNTNNVANEKAEDVKTDTASNESVAAVEAVNEEPVAAEPTETKAE